MVKPTGFREYDARWLFEKEITLRGVQALGLGLGTLLSMFTAITLTQYMLKLMIASKLFSNPAAYGATGFMLWKKEDLKKNA